MQFFSDVVGDRETVGGLKKEAFFNIHRVSTPSFVSIDCKVDEILSLFTFKMDAIFVVQNYNLKLDFLLNVICKLSRGLPRKAGCGILKINVQFKHQSGTQYIEGKRGNIVFFMLLNVLRTSNENMMK